ncbi:hypothetical protein CPB84DRAFT_682694 [Gymnopilus junonius]|uniref:Uncharacterized protein n=1 Tax=Gymnopilus junonius TaxID=109634 RepID=A0A9P5TQ38_GYMJU|nr:hypothetical protein CPB84DRAFT_682694 [Gymnopilus junonius]
MWASIFFTFFFLSSCLFSSYFGMKYMCTCLCYWTFSFLLPHILQLNITCLLSASDLTYISYAPNARLLASFTVTFSWASNWVEWLVDCVQLSTSMTSYFSCLLTIMALKSILLRRNTHNPIPKRITNVAHIRYLYVNLIHYNLFY